MTLEQKIAQSVEYSVINQIKKAEFIKVGYDQKEPLPKFVVEKLWESIDWDSVICNMKPEFERRICNAIIGNMETEIKTDVKAILSVDGVRQKLRIKVYPEIMKILNQTD